MRAIAPRAAVDRERVMPARGRGVVGGRASTIVLLLLLVHGVGRLLAFGRAGLGPAAATASRYSCRRGSRRRGAERSSRCAPR